MSTAVAAPSGARQRWWNPAAQLAGDRARLTAGEQDATRVIADFNETFAEWVGYRTAERYFMARGDTALAIRAADRFHDEEVLGVYSARLLGKHEMPEVYHQFMDITSRLEQHYKEVQDVVNSTLKALNVPVTALFSTLGRTAARGLETKLVGVWAKEFYQQLIANIKNGDTRTFNKEKWEPSSCRSRRIWWASPATRW